MSSSSLSGAMVRQRKQVRVTYGKVVTRVMRNARKSAIRYASRVRSRPPRTLEFRTMDPQTVLAFTLVAIVVELVPGPNFFLLMRTLPSAGLGAGFANIGGFAAAFLLHGTLAVFGLSAAIAASPLALDAVKLLGGAYLMGLGTQTLFELFGARGGARGRIVALAVAGPAIVPAAEPTPPGARAVHRAVVDGFATNLLNPKIALFYIAAFPAFVGVSSAPREAFSLVLVHVLVAVSWFSLVALTFGRVLGAFSSEGVSRGIALSSGVVLLALGAGVVTS